MSYSVRKRAGAKLQAIRTERQVKQEAIACKLKVSRATISKLENGNSPINLYHLLAYAQVTGIAIKVLLLEIGSLLE